MYGILWWITLAFILSYQHFDPRKCYGNRSIEKEKEKLNKKEKKKEKEKKEERKEERKKKKKYI